MRKRLMVFCQGSLIPSTRFRVLNLAEQFRRHNTGIFIANAHVSSYPPDAGKIIRLFWFFKELLFRIPQVIQSYRYDAVILQREMVSTVPTLERFTKRPRILDVDDAIWLSRGGLAANSVANSVDHIVCGNEFLADYFRRFGKPLTVIPTAVETDRFVPGLSAIERQVIGWSGTSSGFYFLYSIESAISEALASYPGWKLRIVSDKKPDFRIISDDKVEFIKWTPENEVSVLQDMAIGIMPIDDSSWSRGKCSYKMLLYMSCQVPVVVSNFGMNREVLGHDFVGYGAVNSEEWSCSLKKLMSDGDLRRQAGVNARKVIVEHYSVKIAVNRWLAVLGQLF